MNDIKKEKGPVFGEKFGGPFGLFFGTFSKDYYQGPGPGDLLVWASMSQVSLTELFMLLIPT